MNILALLDTANSEYPDGFLSKYYDKSGKLIEGSGDGLARFIVVELIETFDPEVADNDQLQKAVYVMANARNELSKVLYAFKMQQTNVK